MLEFAANTNIVLTFPYVNDGVALTLTNFQYQVLDATGTELVAWTSDPSFSASASQSVITILATHNTITTKRDVRQVNLRLVTTAGTYKQTVFYKLKGDLVSLTVMTDSFMTFAESILIRSQISESLDDFDILSDELKAVALEEAFITISKLQFKDGTTVIEDISSYTPTTFAALSTGFKTALKKAQIAEANKLVEDSPILDKIRAGIVSETIGESSMFFNSKYRGTTRFHGISDEAYPYLSPYLYKDSVSAQIWTVRRS